MLSNVKALVDESDGIPFIDRQIGIKLGTGNHIEMIDICVRCLGKNYVVLGLPFIFSQRVISTLPFLRRVKIAISKF